MDSKAMIQEFILTQIVKNYDKKEIEDTEPLIESGIIDSLAIMKLLSFIEEKFQLQIAGDDLIEENFETLNAITQLVEKNFVES